MSTLPGDVRAELTRRMGEKGYQISKETDWDITFSREGYGSLFIEVYSEHIEVSGRGYPSYEGIGNRPRESYRLSLKPKTIGRRLSEQIVPLHEEAYRLGLERKMYEMSLDNKAAEVKKALGEPLSKKIKISWNDNLSKGQPVFRIGLEQEAYGSLTVEDWLAASEVIRDQFAK